MYRYAYVRRYVINIMGMFTLGGKKKKRYNSKKIHGIENTVAQQYSIRFARPICCERICSAEYTRIRKSRKHRFFNLFVS